MFFSFNSIRTKASLLFFILFCAIILPVNWIIYKKIKSELELANQREMTWEAEKLMGQVKLDPLIVPLPASYDLRLQYSDNIHEEIIFSSPDFPPVSSETLSLDYYKFDTLEIINFRKPVKARPGYLILSLERSSTGLAERLQDLRAYLFFASTASIALAGLLVYFASGWMLRPIHRISKAAEKIQASQSIERIPLPDTKDESRRLAEALNAMLARIEHTIKNQTNFFASATHELKTPLAVMKVQLTSGDSPLDEKDQSLVMEVERLESVINDFLLISQLKSDSLVIRKKKVPVTEIIYKALKKISAISYNPTPNIHLTMTDPTTDYSALVDEDKLETVFINLFENAVKYSSLNALHVIVDQQSNDLIITIVNPIKKAIRNLDSLTEEFTKSEELSAGLGMGLWICSQILKLHNGSLLLATEELNFKATLILPKS